MIRLDTTSTILQTVLGAAITTTALEYVVCYSDHTSTAYTGGQQRSTSNNTTDVTICAAPGSSTVRDVDYVSIYNKDSVQATVTVKYDVSGTEHILVKTILGVASTLQYIHGLGWQTIDASGIHLIGNGNANVTITKDVFSGNGSTTAFTLTNSPAAKQQLYVFISGIYQFNSTYSL